MARVVKVMSVRPSLYPGVAACVRTRSCSVKTSQCDAWASATSGSEWSCDGEGCEGDVRPSVRPCIPALLRVCGRAPARSRHPCAMPGSPPPPVVSGPAMARVVKAMSVRPSLYPGVAACVRTCSRSVKTSQCDAWASATSGSEWSCDGEGCEGDVRPSVLVSRRCCVRANALPLGQDVPVRCLGRGCPSLHVKDTYLLKGWQL
ncbi:uncharacterized protein [Emydura macquarii macquarii]|uniref:uncharacterized protein isoform X1 n=1 Tax=Emydura macquarii macquarii TaxID=1129001 RepID=UPI00352A8358